MPNTLQITLSFRPVLDGLNVFTRAFESRMQRVVAFNKSIESGAAAANTMLSQAAAAFSGAQLVQVLNNAISGGVKLNAMLEQQTQAFATLLGSATAAEQRIKDLYDFAASTPFQFPEIVQASKLLQSFSGSALSTGDGLRLVGDAAAAVGKPIADVAMWFGRLYAALRNGMPAGEAVARLTELGLMSGKARQQITALEGSALKSAEVMKVLRQAFGFTSGAMERQAGTLNGLRSTLVDTLGAATAAATETLTKKLKELTQALIQLLQADGVQRIIGAIADSAAAVVGRITSLVSAFTSLGPEGQQAIVSTVGAMTKLAVVTGTVIVPLVLIRGIIATLGTLIDPLRSAFVLIAGVNFSTAVTSLGGFVAKWGALTPFAIKTPQLFQAVLDKGEAVFRLLSFRISGATARAGTFAASWPKVTAGLKTVANALGGLALAAGAFWAGWKLGEMLNELEVGGAKVKDWAAAIVGQLMAWGVEAWGAVRTAWENIAFAFSEFIPAIKITVLEFLIWVGDKFSNTLGEKLGFKIPTDGLKRSLGEARLALQKAADEHLEKLQEIDAETRATAAGFAEVGLEILEQGKASVAAANAKPSAKAPGATAPASDDSLIKSREQMQRELAEIKAQIEVERLQNQERFEANLIDLEAYLAKRTALLRRELKAERDLSETPPGQNAIRLTLAQETADQRKIRRETAEKERQLRLAEAEQVLSQKLGQLANDRATIEGDLYSTAEEKRPKLLKLLEDENRLLTEKIGHLDEIIARETDPEKRLKFQQERDQTKQQQAGKTRERSALEPQTIWQGIAQGVTGFSDSIGTAAQNAANTIRGTLQSAVDGISQGIYGWITKTKTWKDSLLQIGSSVLQTLIQGIVQIIVQETILAGIRKMFANQKAKEDKQNLGIEATSAGLKSVSQLGPIWGPIAFAASLVAIMALVSKFATGGLVNGPGSGTSDSVMARLSNGEFVARASAVDRFGPTFFERLNAGVLDLGTLPGNVSRGMALPAPSGGLGGPAAGDGGREDLRTLLSNFSERITVVVVQGEQEAKRIDRHSRARGDIVRIVREEQAQILRRGV